MKFYDRENEQKQLRKVLLQSRKEAQMTVLMGRRRIGKTELSLMCGDEKVLYFFVGKKSEPLLCHDFLREIGDKLGSLIIGQLNSFSEVFRLVLELAKRQPFT